MTDWTETDCNGVRGYAKGDLWYPRTSAILDVLMPLPMRYLPQEALSRGTRLHAAVCSAVRSGGWLGAKNGLSGEDQASFQAVAKWVKAHVKRVVMAEEVIISKRYGYASRIDCAVVTKSGQFVVLDWKFAEAHDTRYVIQAEAHRQHIQTHL